MNQQNKKDNLDKSQKPDTEGLPKDQSKKPFKVLSRQELGKLSPKEKADYFTEGMIAGLNNPDNHDRSK